MASFQRLSPTNTMLSLVNSTSIGPLHITIYIDALAGSMFLKIRADARNMDTLAFRC